MRIKKNFAVVLHIIFLLTVVAGISIMYLHSQIGAGIGWITF